MGAKTGHDMVLVRNSGTVETPVWEEISAIGDVNVSDWSIAVGDLKHRGSDYVKGLPGLFQRINIDFNLIHGLDPDNFEAMRLQFLGRTPCQYAVLDGDIEDAGTEGLIIPALIVNFPWNQPLEDVSDHAVQLTTGLMFNALSAEVDPEWLVVEEGSGSA